MSRFFLPVGNLIHYYGRDINVFVLPEAKRVDGVWDKPKLSDITPLKKHEVVVPASALQEWTAQFVAGGGNLVGDVLWLSLGDYPKLRTIVQIASSGKYFKVMDGSAFGHKLPNGGYEGYSDLKIYQLKGDSENPLGY